MKLFLFNPNTPFNVGFPTSTASTRTTATTTGTKLKKQKYVWFRFTIINLVGIMLLLYSLLLLCYVNFFHTRHHSLHHRTYKNTRQKQQTSSHGSSIKIHHSFQSSSVNDNIQHSRTKNRRLVPSIKNDLYQYRMYNNNNTTTDPTWIQYYYNQTRMQFIRKQWINHQTKVHSQQYIDSAFVIIIQQHRHQQYVSSLTSLKQQEQEQEQLLMDTIHYAVRYTQLAQILVYVSDYDSKLVSLITATFQKDIEIGQLILLLNERPIIDWNDQQYSSIPAYDDLRDGLTYAYLLDLAYQHGSKYTLLVPVGWQLNTADNYPNDYIEQAIQHYILIEESRKMVNDWNRTCWTVLSDHPSNNQSSSSSSSSSPPHGVLFFDTVEHASRMSILLRSSLPYNYKNYLELLEIYCHRFIWSGSVIFGPPLFTKIIKNNYTEPEDHDTTVDVLSSTSAVSKSFVVEEDIHAPGWIDPNMTKIGPQIVNDNNDDIKTPPYLITFGVTTMLRPVVNTTYLHRFMNDLINIVERHFAVVPKGAGHGTSQYSAIVVVLIGGNTLQDIHTLRRFLEDTYAAEIKRNMVQLVDSPLESYSNKLSMMRKTFHLEPQLRRYWRSKQNLDVGFLFREISGLSKYVMLLEDDTGFQPEFANRLKATLDEDSKLDYSSTFPWAQTMYGFGYSGVLLHTMDVPVYATLHTTFFDERPCDILDIWRLIRDGKRIYIYSPPKLRYRKKLYLKHLGVQSSLIGKQQIVW